MAQSVSDGHLAGGRGSTAKRDKRFLSSTMSRLALGPIQPPIQWASAIFLRGGKAAGL
jgi:hypothetical protein